MTKVFYYLEPQTGLAIQVRAKRKPSPKTGNQTMVVYEWQADRNEWCMACFPEVSWGTLSKMQYLGSGK